MRFIIVALALMAMFSTASDGGCTWRTHGNRYLEDYIDEDHKVEISLQEAKAQCIENSHVCGGVTCNQDGTKCTMRKGPGMQNSPNSETSYVYQCGSWFKMTNSGGCDHGYYIQHFESAESLYDAQKQMLAEPKCNFDGAVLMYSPTYSKQMTGGWGFNCCEKETTVSDPNDDWNTYRYLEVIMF